MNQGQMMRLASYYAVTDRLLTERATSDEMARMLNIHPSQIRRDMREIGFGGTQGQGYKLSDLREKLMKILNPLWGEVVEQAKHDRKVAVWILDMTYPKEG